MLRILLMVTVVLSGCSVQRLGIRAASGVLGTAAKEIETETNWEIFRQAVPATMKTLEGLLYVDPTNEDLLLALTKAYAGYAFGVNETLFIPERIGDKDYRPNWEAARRNHSRALSYGVRYLALNDIDFLEVRNAMKVSDKSLTFYFDSKLDGSDTADIEAAFFTGQAWGSLVNLQRNDARVFAQLPVAKALIDWACLKRPNFQHGACKIFYGSYEVGRPKMLGGNLPKGKQIFRDLIAKDPDNLIVRVAFIETYAIPALDEKEYKRQKAYIVKAIHKRRRGAFLPDNIVAAHGKAANSLGLFNAIAEKRFALIRLHEKEVFD